MLIARRGLDAALILLDGIPVAATKEVMREHGVGGMSDSLKGIGKPSTRIHRVDVHCDELERGPVRGL